MRNFGLRGYRMRWSSVIRMPIGLDARWFGWRQCTALIPNYTSAYLLYDRLREYLQINVAGVVSPTSAGLVRGPVRTGNVLLPSCSAWFSTHVE